MQTLLGPFHVAEESGSVLGFVRIVFSVSVVATIFPISSRHVDMASSRRPSLMSTSFPVRFSFCYTLTPPVGSHALPPR